MKDGIHATIHQEAKTKCLSCNTVYVIPGTLESTEVEFCRNCHPVYTGKSTGAARGGRVERFRARQAKGKQLGA